MTITKKNKVMIVVLISGAMLSIINQTMVSPALPSIMQETNVDAITAQWLLSGFTLVNAVVIPLSAYLQDRFTTRKLFICAFGFFGAGSLLAAWGINFGVLLAGRLLQAVCAGMLMPMVMTILLLIFPRDRRGFAMGIFNLVIMFAPAIGPVVAGILTDAIGWHVLFLLMGALAVVVIVVAALALKNFGTTSRPSLDKPSVALSCTGLMLLLYGLSALGHLENAPYAAVLIAVGVVHLHCSEHRLRTLSKILLKGETLVEMV
jgi:MFS family permease